jgi:hypothetical protein
MLASGAGRLVPFDDPAALADAVCAYIDEPETLCRARRGRRIGSSLAWPSVAEATAAVLREAHELAPRRGRWASPTCSSRVFAPTICSRWSTTSASCSTRTAIIPNRETGYCVDDVARLAVVALALARRGDEQAWTSILYRALAFLHARRRTRAGCATS